LIGLYEFNKVKAFNYEYYLDMPLFEYLYVLQKSKIMSLQDCGDWHYSIDKKIRTIELDVSREDVIENLRKQLVPDVTLERLEEIVDSKLFKYDNVVDNIRISRVFENAQKAQNKIKASFTNMIEDIIKN
jgi:hypothetical protein